jgi:hypothetical protein
MRDLQSSRTLAGTRVPSVSMPVTIPESLHDLKEIRKLYVVDYPFEEEVYKSINLPVVAYRGLHDGTDDNLNVLHTDLFNFCRHKEVSELIVISPADIFDISIAFKAGDDIYNALKTRYTGLRKFFELVFSSQLELTLRWGILKQSNLISNVRTLSDLIWSMNSIGNDELSDRIDSRDETWIDWHHIHNSGFSHKMYGSLFKLNSKEAFYDKYRDLLSESEWIYNGVTCWFNGETIDSVKYNEAKSYIRVGTDYYKIVKVPNKHGELEENLIAWRIGTIHSDFVKKGYKRFTDSIPKYDAFCNVPENSERHSREINNCYNLYHPMEHQPREGEWKKTEAFLKHIANQKNTSGQSMYPFLLDYLTLLLTKPTQMLPVLCLVSKERNTGKSTLLKMLRLIFKENMTILGNEQFQGKFTKHYITKLIIALDEGFIPIEQKVVKERIKNLATSDRQFLEGKGKDPFEIDYFGKLILCSNDERNFMQIDTGENRFAVLKISMPLIDDPNLLEALKAEIPAFLYFLFNRPLHYKEQKSRFHFDATVYETPALLKVMDSTKSILEREMIEFLSGQFLDFQQDQLQFTLKDLLTALNETSRYKFLSSTLKEYLQEDLHMVPSKGTIRYRKYHLEDDPIKETAFIGSIRQVGRVYTFHKANWIKEKEN